MIKFRITKTDGGWVLSSSPDKHELSACSCWAKAYFFSGASPKIYWYLPPATTGFALELKQEVSVACAFTIAFTDVVNEYRDLLLEQASKRLQEMQFK